MAGCIEENKLKGSLDHFSYSRNSLHLFQKLSRVIKQIGLLSAGANFGCSFVFCHLFTLINPKACFFLKKSHYLKKTVMLDIVVIILGFNSIHRQVYDRKLILRQ